MGIKRKHLSGWEIEQKEGMLFNFITAKQTRYVLLKFQDCGTGYNTKVKGRHEKTTDI